MKNDHEFTGTLLGFDDFVSKSFDFDHLSLKLIVGILLSSIDMVLDDVTE